MKLLYFEAILTVRIDLVTNEKLSIIIYSQVQLSWEQPACVIDQQIHVSNKLGNVRKVSSLYSVGLLGR